MLVFVLTVLPAMAEGQGKHLFILSGQSNMAGLRPELSFIPTVQEALGKESVIVIKDAQGGQPIHRWYKKWKPVKGDEPDPEMVGDLYDRMMKKVDEAVKGKKILTVTFIWMQGESDANRFKSGVYAASMRGLIDQLAADLNRDDLNFVIGRISDYGNNRRHNSEYWMAVREAQEKVAEADPRGAWIDTDDLNDGLDKRGKEIKNKLHYSAEGYKILGQRFAEKAIALIKK